VGPGLCEEVCGKNSLTETFMLSQEGFSIHCPSSPLLQHCFRKGWNQSRRSSNCVVGRLTCTLWGRAFCASMQCTGRACSCQQGCLSLKKSLPMASWYSTPSQNLSHKPMRHVPSSSIWEMWRLHIVELSSLSALPLLNLLGTAIKRCCRQHRKSQM